MDTLVHIKGILKEPIVDSNGGLFRQWFAPRYVKFKSATFNVRHKNGVELVNAINTAMQDIKSMQGMTVTVNETKAKTPDNMQFWPIHNFQHFEVELYKLTVPVPTDGKETIN